MSAVTAEYPALTRKTTLTWDGENAPTVEYNKRSGNATSLSLIYRYDFEANKWRGDWRCQWVWRLKSGELGNQSHDLYAYPTPGWITEALAIHLPKTVIEFVESAVSE